ASGQHRIKKTGMVTFLKNIPVKSAMAIFTVAVCIYGLILTDLHMRAREAYRRGERYYSWCKNPAGKKAFLRAEYAMAEHRLNAVLAAGRITGQRRDELLEQEVFKRDLAMEEDSVRAACAWYGTAALFSPPRSVWTRMAEEKLAELCPAPGGPPYP
ncbi:MAG: hypothetical protein ABIG11_08480, partial [bacterium]